MNSKHAILHLKEQPGKQGCLAGIKNSNQKIITSITQPGFRPGQTFKKRTGDILSLVNKLMQSGQTTTGTGIELPLHIREQKFVIGSDETREDVLSVSQNDLLEQLGLSALEKDAEVIIGILETAGGIEPEALVEKASA